MKRGTTRLLSISLILLFAGTIFQSCGSGQGGGENAPEVTTEPVDKMEWWREARFGMFIHWGLYAIPAGEYNGVKIDRIGEWIMNNQNIPIKEYEKYASQFNPVQFNADQWVSIAKNAGMKYIVITSKHHDGFCLWDSKVTGYDIMDASPFGRDILKELSEACEKQGIRLCFYHSIMDWHHPWAQAIWEPYYNKGRQDTVKNPEFPRYFEEYLKPQVKELVTGYGDIGVMWFDGEWVPAYTTEMGKEMYDFIMDLDPDMIINNRVDKGRMGMSGMNKEGVFAGDFGTPEQEIPDQGLDGVDWESCMTMNDTWGFKAHDHNWKSSEDLIRKLVDIVSKGGNFLLNVGPTAEGLIPEPSVERLADMGEWMEVNGESIIGASASPFEKPEWGRYTKKGNLIYAHVFHWPGEGLLQLNEGVARIKKAYLLSDQEQQELKTVSEGEQLWLKLPEKAPDPVASVIVLVI